MALKGFLQDYHTTDNFFRETEVIQMTLFSCLFIYFLPIFVHELSIITDVKSFFKPRAKLFIKSDLWEIVLH